MPSELHRLAPATFRAHIRAESAGSQADQAREKRDRVAERDDWPEGHDAVIVGESGAYAYFDDWEPHD